MIYIPKTIKAGYNARSDTYSGKLAYVIYTDDKGVLRKENSWKGWIKPELGIDDFDNVPTEGFVINRNGGGNGRGWDSRTAFIRVYDPRGFEIEISVENLLFILQESTSSQGKGLEGEFIYSWSGKDLVLLPVSSQEYKNSVSFTSLQSKKISKSDIKVGYSVKFKDTSEAIYLGRFDYYEKIYDYSERNSRQIIKSTKKHVFIKYNEDGELYYHTEGGFTKIAEITQDTEICNYAELVVEYCSSMYGSKLVDIELTEQKFDFDDFELSYNGNKLYNQKFALKNNNSNIVHVYSFCVYSDNEMQMNVDATYKINGSDTYKYNDYDALTYLFGIYQINHTSSWYAYSRKLSMEDFNKMKDNFLELKFILESGNKIECSKYLIK